MYPRVELGPVTIYTYGLMLALGLAVAIALLCLEFRRKQLDPAHAIWIALIAVVSGVIGSRLLFIIETWDRFIADPVRVTFSGVGLSSYGGVGLATLAVYVYVKAKSIGFLVFADAAAPGALLARGIGRLGCHLSGDGDYGGPTSLPWGTDYSHGVYPPSAAIAAVPELAQQFPGGVAPDNLAMHPTGVYEFLLAAILFAMLWRYRLRMRSGGTVFMLYLLIAGGLRFSLEFLALAPRIALGLTEAQLISVGLTVIGGVGLWYRRPCSERLRP